MSKENCRVCLEKGGTRNLFENRYSSTISSKIMSLANIEIYPQDGLPSTICLKCVKFLDKITHFIELCRESDAKLRAMLLVKIEPQISKNEESNCNEQQSKENIEFVSVKNEVNAAAPTKEGEDIKINKQQCTICGKILSSRFRLKAHLRIHTGERPFPCPHCSKSFALNMGLKLHLRIHTGVKPFECPECKLKFRHSTSLRAHRRTHTGETPYTCTLCPKTFYTASHLQYHVRKHTGEKKFECSTCEKAFISRSHLQQHVILHTGEKPHMCSVCGVRLSRASHLRRHMITLHQITNTELPEEKDAAKKEPVSKPKKKKPKASESSPNRKVVSNKEKKKKKPCIDSETLS